MIPVRLKLVDFLSYRGVTEIDFSAFDVACLTGTNGSGKTAILDGVSWALFGAARGCEGGQNTDRLIGDGRDQTTVELTFELAGDTYRIIRSRSRRGRGDVRLLVKAGEEWTNLAAESVRETEARIGGLLRMDYQTYAASAYLLQGRADDFLRMPPDRRKDVLVRLLDLGVYERLEDAARASARDALGRQRSLAVRLDELGGVAADLGIATRELEAAESAARTTAALASETERTLDELRAEQARLDAQAAVAERERHAVESLTARVGAARDALARKMKELEELDALVTREGEVRQALAELERLEAQDSRLRDTARHRAELEHRKATLAGRIDAEAREITTVAKGHLERADTLDLQAAELEADQQALGRLDALVAELTEADGTLEEVRSHLEALRAEDGALGQELQSLQSRREEVAEKLALVSGADATCPVCDGDLGPQHRKQIVAKLRTEDAGLDTGRKACESRRAEVRKEGKRLREEQDRLSAALARRDPLLRQAADLRARVALAPQRRAEATQLRLLAEAQTTRLRDGDFAVELRGELASLQASLADASYDPDLHEQVRARIGTLVRAREDAGRIAEASARRDTVVGERAELEDRITEDEADLTHRRELLASLADAPARASEADRAVEKARAACDLARARAGEAGALVARMQERVGGLQRSVEELERARAAERDAAVEHRRFTRLTQAFGRGGIPDLILENALPELSYEANDVLGRLSDYEMSVQFVMQRDTKSGKPRETFDVNVHHDGGVRDFQMFSGGEAFRIAFAIRLGLSKLLVRRAGARLETLVIDEGFGTQDTEGRERLVEAINLARQEFRKVLVISHLDELKDAFPAQLRVTKDPALGSRLSLVGC